MTTTLLCLHGFSQNGSVLREHMQPLLARLPAALQLEFPDAPHECSAASVERLQRFMPDTKRPPPPHRCYWDSTDDGRVYRGWETSRDLLVERVAGRERVGLLGFSQGAIVSAALCGLSTEGGFPKPAFAVLVAGRKPRADLMQSWFQTPLDIPTLHVWGTKDAFACAESPTLLACFKDAKQQCWAGPHMLPTRGEAADVMVDFVQAHA